MVDSGFFVMAHVLQPIVQAVGRDRWLILKTEEWHAARAECDDKFAVEAGEIVKKNIKVE